MSRSSLPILSRGGNFVMRGSIVKRGTSVSLVMYQGLDPITKKQRYKWIPCKDVKQAEAMRAVLATHPAYGSGVGPSGSSRLRFGDFLDQWLQTSVKARCRPTEARAKEIAVRLHIKPLLGHLPLAKISASTLERFFAGPHDVELSRIYRILRTALNHAVRTDLILSNPCAQIDAPRARSYRPTLWTPEEASAFLQAAATHTRHYPLFLLLMTTGIRPGGEVLGLRWKQNVDLERGVLTLSHALYRTSPKLLDTPSGQNRIQFVELKTKTAYRPVRLASSVVDVLRALQRTQRVSKIGLGPRYVNNDLVFCQPTGLPLWWDNIIRAFDAVIEHAKLRKTRVYDLRHFHLSMLATEGVNLKTIQERAGHSRASFTLDRYIHTAPDSQGPAVAAIERVLANGLQMSSEAFRAAQTAKTRTASAS